MSKDFDAVAYWLNTAGRQPLLTPAEEIHQSQLVRAWLDTESPTARQVRAGQRAKERMIAGNLRLCTKVVSKYRGRLHRDCSLAVEDLLQESVVGLSRAVDKFDPEKGYKFSTYAFLWLRQSVGRLTDLAGTIKTPTASIQLMTAYKYKPKELSDEDFCELRGVTVERLKLELELAARAHMRSLDSLIRSSEDETSTLLSTIGSPAERVDYEDDRADANAILDVLKEVAADDLALIELREDFGASQVADLLGVSRSRAANKVRQARERCRELLPAAC